MPNRCSSVCTSVDNRLDTKIKFHKVTNIWRIENFSVHEAIGDDLKSSPFSAIDDSDTKWYLELEPNFTSDGEDYINFYVNLCSKKEVFVKFSTCFLDQAQQEITSSRKSINELQNLIVRPNETDDNCGWEKFHEKNDHFRNTLLIDNTLTVKCVITYCVRGDVDNLRHECLNAPLYPNVAECDISHHLGLLLENHNLADVVLSVEGKEYPAHKNILAARSPVFAAMFAHHNAKENEENRVCIDDLNEKVVGDMLRFIYTGKCENLRELATGLLVAADKYDLDRLKMICANELYENLSVENAASILALADMHGVKELKNKVIEFIISKPTEVLDTEGWKRVRSNFELADQVFSTLAQQLKSKD